MPSATARRARAAQLVETPGCRLLWDAGGHCRLTGRVLPFTGGKDLAHDHFIHVGRINARALQSAGDGSCAKLMRRHGSKSAIEGSDGCTRRRCNNH
jgi:hypothetical protein